MVSSKGSSNSEAVNVKKKTSLPTRRGTMREGKRARAEGLIGRIYLLEVSRSRNVTNVYKRNDSGGKRRGLAKLCLIGRAATELEARTLPGSIHGGGLERG